MAVLIDGKKIQTEIKEELRGKIATLDKPLTLAIVQIGELEESNRYIKHKKKFAEELGVNVVHEQFPNDVTEEVLINKIKDLNQNEDVDGIIVQLPLPQTINTERVIETIKPEKDVDGQTSKNYFSLIQNKEGIIPATARGILILLEKYGINVEGKNVVVLGRSNLVGKPTALSLLNKNATVTICHSKTVNEPEITRNADILISAVGKPRFATKDFVKRDQVVIDVGINVLTEDGGPKLVGDIDFENVKDEVGYISPVPGGVGPMTIAGLFLNLFETRS